ncbi:MAG TPA: wax ester/triacylglycerol synthase domain-containing protein [Candidatus Dormibacteraeota bacterium]|nr:wax ester/triacylglycerol synthase domain-containing protein [Candidatus Dormibacteraeota bacterium]
MTQPGSGWRTRPFDRFRPRVVEATFGVGPPRWVDDDRFDLDSHVHHLALPAPGGKIVLEEMAGDLMRTPLDMSKPLWQLHLIDGYEGGSVLLTRLHHCIAEC